MGQEKKTKKRTKNQGETVKKAPPRRAKKATAAETIAPPVPMTLEPAPEPSAEPVLAPQPPPSPLPPAPAPVTPQRMSREEYAELLAEDLKARKKADAYEEKVERKKLKAARREEKRLKKKQKDDGARPARDERLFSEKHKRLHESAMALLPRLHTIAILLLLIYAGTMEVVHGNIDFPLDWYQDSFILPAAVDLMSHPDFIEEWFATYGAIFITITSLIVMGLATAYVCVWRYFFKDYYLIIVDNWTEKHELTEVKDGRLYWYTDNVWYRLWDRLYHGHSVKRQKSIYLKQSPWWHPFNIINPANSLIKIDLSPEEFVESRGVYSVFGHEKPIRTRVGRRTYMTEEKAFHTDRVPLEQAEDAFNKANERLVDETRTLTQGNAALRLEQMRDGGFTLNPKVREMLRHDSTIQKPDA
jgi:hypothetical protein